MSYEIGSRVKRKRQSYGCCWLADGVNDLDGVSNLVLAGLHSEFKSFN